MMTSQDLVLLALFLSLELFIIALRNFWFTWGVYLCIEVNELDLARFLTTIGLSRQAALSKTKVKLDLLTEIDMSLMAEKRYQRRNMPHYLLIWERYMKDYDKNKELSNLKYWVANNSYGSAMSKKLPVNDFKWVENIF